MRWETHSWVLPCGGLHAEILTQQKQVCCFLDHFLNILMFCCCCFLKEKKTCSSACLPEARRKTPACERILPAHQKQRREVRRQPRELGGLGRGGFINKRREQRSLRSPSRRTQWNKALRLPAQQRGGRLGGARPELLTQQPLPLSGPRPGRLSELLGTETGSPPCC